MLWMYFNAIVFPIYMDLVLQTKVLNIYVAVDGGWRSMHWSLCHQKIE